jgi:hypothetical protein
MTPRRLSKIVLAVALVASPIALLVLRYRAHEASLASRVEQNAPPDDGHVTLHPDHDTDGGDR